MAVDRRRRASRRVPRGSAPLRSAAAASYAAGGILVGVVSVGVANVLGVDALFPVGIITALILLTVILVLRGVVMIHFVRSAGKHLLRVRVVVFLPPVIDTGVGRTFYRQVTVSVRWLVTFGTSGGGLSARGLSYTVRSVLRGIGKPQRFAVKINARPIMTSLSMVCIMMIARR